MLKRFETVLIGTSLTEASDQVVRAGLEVARAAGARVALVHACSPPLVYAGAPCVPEPPDIVESREKGLQRKMEAQLSGVPRGELAGTWIEPGPAHQAIVGTAKAAGADLIVVGAAEEPILAKMLGSTADRVLRRAACPVLVVRRELSLPLARVLVPLDLSPLSAAGLREELKVLDLLAGGGAKRIDVEALCLDAGPEEEPGRFLARHAAGSAFGIAHRTVSGYVEDEILRRIREWEPDLVVLGTHGRSGRERFLLGSVATWVLHNGESNVLIVPPAAAREHGGDLIPVLSERRTQ